MSKIFATICFVYVALCAAACVVTLDPHLPTILAAVALVLAGWTIHKWGEE